MIIHVLLLKELFNNGANHEKLIDKNQSLERYYNESMKNNHTQTGV